MSTDVEAIQQVQGEKPHVEHVSDIKEAANLRVDAIEAENIEHRMGVLEAAKRYPMACFWAFVMSSTIIMEAYCVFIMGSFVALPAFRDAFGIDDGQGGKVIETSWQSALQCGGPVGALIGVFIAGPFAAKVGYRWATITALMFLNAFIFIFFFANSLPVFFVSQLLEGIPWGVFIGLSPAYCSEIVPMRLRAPATQVLQLFWAVGAIIVGGVCYAYQGNSTSTAWKVPTALQWLFPTPLAILLYIAPESPWWLVRNGKYEEAARSIERLGRRSLVNSAEGVAMMRRVVERESDEKPTLIECFRKTDRRRTLIVCGIYAAQNLAGNLIANQAVFFFEQAGMPTETAFALGLVVSALQAVAVIGSWVLTSYFGRRPIYIWGTAFNVVMLIALGIAATIPVSSPAAKTAASNAQAAFGLIVSVWFTFMAAPVSYAVIAETSSIRLRPLTTGVGRAAYYIINIPCIFLGSWMLNPTGGNLGGKCGYVWGGTALFCLVVAYFGLPEYKDRSYRELDILFSRRVPARKFKSTQVSIEDDE